MNEIAKLNLKKQKLNELSIYLKNHFIGIDPIIDKIIENMQVWYLFPNVITRPVIINLWGLTGIGKTDLIRKLVNFLEFSDRFLEIQMQSYATIDEDNSTWALNVSVEQMLLNSEINEGQQGILFIDEFQKFRTLSEEGFESNDQKAFQDLWALLSDGKFAPDPSRKRKAMEYFMGLLYEIENKETVGDIFGRVKNKSKKSKSKYKLETWRAQLIKNLLKLKEPMEKIMEYSKEDVVNMFAEKIDSNSLNEGYDYSKLLIFISGNLDEAYKMAKDVDDADINADVLYEYSKQITINTIKHSLLRRFRPEQISRLGNTHVIYPSLNVESYQKLIDRKLDEIAIHFKKEANINLSFSHDFKKTIYKNSVYPAQGVRPVFSTVSSISNVIPKFFLKIFNEGNHKMFGKNKKLLEMNLDYKSEHIVCKYIEQTDGSSIFIYEPYIFDIDAAKKKNDANSKMMISVHETGHALIYSYVYNCVPKQIKSDLSLFNGGYVITHDVMQSKEYLLNECKVMLAGVCAEKVIFGQEKVTNGSQSDIEQATETIANMHRWWAMGKNISAMINAENEQACSYNTDMNSTNDDIEKEMKKIRKDVENILSRPNMKKALVEISEILFNRGELTPEEYLKLVQKYLPTVKMIEFDKTISENYIEIFNKVKSQL